MPLNSRNRAVSTSGPAPPDTAAAAIATPTRSSSASSRRRTPVPIRHDPANPEGPMLSRRSAAARSGSNPAGSVATPGQQRGQRPSRHTGARLEFPATSRRLRHRAGARKADQVSLVENRHHGAASRGEGGAVFRGEGFGKDVDVDLGGAARVGHHHVSAPQGMAHGVPARARPATDTHRHRCAGHLGEVGAQTCQCRFIENRGTGGKTAASTRSSIAPWWQPPRRRASQPKDNCWVSICVRVVAPRCSWATMDQCTPRARAVRPRPSTRRTPCGG